MLIKKLLIIATILITSCNVKSEEEYLFDATELAENGKHQDAIEVINKVLKTNPNNTLAYFNLGLIFKEKEDYQKSIECFNKAFNTKGGDKRYIDYVPNDFVPSSHYDVPGHEIAFERGIPYTKIDSLNLAVNDFLICIEKKYMIKESHASIGYCYLISGMTSEACKEFKFSARLGDKFASQMLSEYCDEN